VPPEAGSTLQKGGVLILAEEMPIFSARIPNDGSKTAFLHKNSNPCRKNA
jgi:hypothetical protein